MIKLGNWNVPCYNSVVAEFIETWSGHMGKMKMKRPLVLASVILGMFMSAMEATIVSTAMPTIVADLGGFSLFSWVFSSYLLMQVITVPIYGKLADIYGRKIIYSIGVSIFVLGSLLCGLSSSIEFLIISRFIQGFGAGAVQPIATTIVGDIYTKEERAKIQGYLASVWGISSIIGPVLGGVIIELAHWKWIYWINVPFGILSMVGVIKYLKEDIEKVNQKIDYFGSAFLLISVTALMIIFIQGGTYWAWSSPQMISLVIIVFIFTILFLWQEKRAEDPVMSLSIWKHRLIVVANVASLLLGATLVGVSSYLPTYVQVVLNQPAVIAGFTLTVMSIGWPISSTLAGKWVITLGARRTAFIGGINLLIGASIFLTLSYIQHPIWAGLGSFFIGSGMGFSTTTFIVSIQSSVPWRTRGVATASNSFMRLLGSALGVALLGGIMNSSMQRHLENKGDMISFEPTIDMVNQLLDPTSSLHFTDAERAILEEGVALALNSIYIGVFVLALISFILIQFLPKGNLEEEKVEG